MTSGILTLTPTSALQHSIVKEDRTVSCVDESPVAKDLIRTGRDQAVAGPATLAPVGICTGSKVQ